MKILCLEGKYDGDGGTMIATVEITSPAELQRLLTMATAPAVTPSGRAPYTYLTSEQHDTIVRLIGVGMTSPAIADELGLDHRKVQNYVHNKGLRR